MWRGVNTDLLISTNTMEQQVRKHAEGPVINCSDDCECQQQLSAVADLLHGMSKMATTLKRSGRNTTLDCQT
jgi:hypothetical protein